MLLSSALHEADAPAVGIVSQNDLIQETGPDHFQHQFDSFLIRHGVGGRRPSLGANVVVADVETFPCELFVPLQIQGISRVQMADDHAGWIGAFI